MNHYEIKDLVPIVAELTDKYTSKESTSIPYRTAMQLMEAVLYCIEENYQKPSFSQITSSLTAGTGLPPRAAYEQGYQLVLKKVMDARVLFNSIMESFHSYGNRNYYDTVVKGMPAFFINYDARFHPQYHILTLDYPTLVSTHTLQGVDAIFQYLSYIRLEQLFLNAYPETYIREVLGAFSSHFEDLVINVCSIILRNIMGCVIAEKPVMDLGYSPEQYKKIREFSKCPTKAELRDKLLKLLGFLWKQGYPDNPELLPYLDADMENFSFELFNAAENDCLETLFPL